MHQSPNENLAKVCLVVPCYNEADRIDLPAFENFMGENTNYHFCFVDDGSSDDTFQKLKSFQRDKNENVLVAQNEQNSGKAEAVRNGMTQSADWKAFDFIGYMDADLATPFTEMKTLVEVISKRENCPLVLGSRVERLGAKIDRAGYRRYFGRVFAELVRILFKIRTYDSQCGAKIFRQEVVKETFAEKFTTKWLFDIEVLLRLIKINPEYRQEIIEYPINEWHEMGNTRIKSSELLRVPFDLLKIRKRYMR